MISKPRILVVEDDSRVVVFLTDILEHMGFRVLTARNGIQGLLRARGERPDLVVLDVMLPEMDGYEVCRQIKADSDTNQMPILMLTAKGQLPDRVKGLGIGADDFLAKPFEKEEFEARVNALLRRSVHPPYLNTQSGAVFSLTCVPGQRINVRANGPSSVNTITRDVLDIDTDVFARRADNVPLLDWRFNSKQVGMELFREIFVRHPEIMSNYNQTLGEIGEQETHLHILFESPRDFLRIPLEFLFSDSADFADYLVLHNPLVRSVTGLRVRRMPLSPIFLNQLWASRNSLEILLIASNTEPEIPGVDEEIRVLKHSLRPMFEQKGIRVEITTLQTEVATYEKIKETIQNRRFHIIHYAGHGHYDKRSPEKSALFFWEQENRCGNVREVPVSELKVWLNSSDLRFMYLSCCLGAKSGETVKLLDDDFLGLADGIIHAGVPSVLGFWWPVSDDGARTLASAFYQSFASHGIVDEALLYARQQIASRDRDDITWLSPILIMQA